MFKTHLAFLIFCWFFFYFNCNIFVSNCCPIFPQVYIYLYTSRVLEIYPLFLHFLCFQNTDIWDKFLIILIHRKWRLSKCLSMLSSWKASFFTQNFIVRPEEKVLKTPEILVLKERISDSQSNQMTFVLW